MAILRLENKNNKIGAICRIEYLYDYVELMLNVCEYIILHKKEIEHYYSYDPIFDDVLISDNRLFVFYNKAKYVSIHFPFRVALNGDIYHISRGIPLTNDNISHIRRALNHIRDHKMYLIDGISECNINLKPTDYEYITAEEFDLLSILLTVEPAYIRYDWDKKNANGNYHPEIHFDINFSKMGTYKIGLNVPFSPKRFFELFKDNIPCEYIENGDRHTVDCKHSISKLIDSLLKITSDKTDLPIFKLIDSRKKLT